MGTVFETTVRKLDELMVKIGLRQQGLGTRKSSCIEDDIQGIGKNPKESSCFEDDIHGIGKNPKELKEGSDIFEDPLDGVVELKSYISETLCQIQLDISELFLKKEDIFIFKNVSFKGKNKKYK